MPVLNDEDIQTREVLGWKGIHLLHFVGSTCSQKTRIFLGLKGIEWQSRPVDLPRYENYSEWFMGINPRGLVPVLIDDGKVIIESNDILTYLENKFPEPSLIPSASNEEAQQLLDEEDALHHDIRAISFRYAFPGVRGRSDELIENYQKFGSGTIGGKPDPKKNVETEFHRDVQLHDGISDERVKTAAHKFRNTLDRLNDRLEHAPWLLGDQLSVIDIAWYIYCIRLRNAGYPIHELHPKLGNWFDGLDDRPEFHGEVTEPPKLLEMRAALHEQQKASNTTLIQVAGF